MDSNEKLKIIWDTDVNMEAVRDRVHSLPRGCKCATGCTTSHCGCKKRDKTCSIGCQCLNCSNTDHANVVSQRETDQEVAQIAVDDDRFLDREDVEDMTDWVFGQECDEKDLNSELDSSDSELED